MNTNRIADDVPAPYRMLEPVDASGIQASFRKQLAESLSPLLTEVVSQHTRQLQQQLLVVAAILVLLSFSVITIGGEVTWNGVKLKVVGDSAVAIAFAVTVYLELVVAIRSLLEWSAWQLQAGAAQLSLAEAVRSSFANAPSGADSLTEAFREHVSASFDRHADDGEPLDDEELSRRALQRSREREQRQSEREDTRAKTAWIDSRVAPLRRLNALRVASEVLFPVLLGGVALTLAAAQRL